MSNVPGLIDVSQLREEIGDPTTNTQFAGHVTDEMLQNIIDRHVDALESQAFQRLKDGLKKPVMQTNPVQVDLSKDSNLPGVASGKLGSDFFPYATEGIIKAPSTYEGKPLDYQRDLPREASKIFYEAYLFDIENNTVLVMPEDVTSVELFCPLRGVAIQEIMGDVLNKVNSNIINKAKQMVQARTQEFAEPAYAGEGGVAQDD